MPDPIVPIRSAEDHAAVLAEIDRLIRLGAPEGTPEDDRLLVLGVLAADWEERTIDIPLPDPIDAIALRLADLGMTRADLEPILGGGPAVAEVFARRRALSVGMVRGLAESLGLPLKVLVQPYALETPQAA